MATRARSHIEPQRNNKQRQMASRPQYCKFFNKGGCHYGDKCHYLHEKLVDVTCVGCGSVFPGSEHRKFCGPCKQNHKQSLLDEGKMATRCVNCGVVTYLFEGQSQCRDCHRDSRAEATAKWREGKSEKKCIDCGEESWLGDEHKRCRACHHQFRKNIEALPKCGTEDCENKVARNSDYCKECNDAYYAERRRDAPEVKCASCKEMTHFDAERRVGDPLCPKCRSDANDYVVKFCNRCGEKHTESKGCKR